MNPALTYLWLALLKRRGLHFCRGLRRPTTLLGFAAVLCLLGVLFYYRNEEFFSQLIRREILIGAMLIMLCGSLFKGFLQRGLVFDLADMEFLFTSPFTQRQIIFYRLLPSYLFAFLQGLVFLALFEPHLKHPLLTTVCFILFQIACFHLETGAAIFAGAISASAHHRVRWMTLGAYFLIAALYLHTAWGLQIIPSFVTAPCVQLLFYPAVTLRDVSQPQPVLEWTLALMRTDSVSLRQLGQSALYLGAFAGGALASLWLVLRLKADIFETSLATTTRVAEKRLRVQQGRRATVIPETQFRSVRLPQLALFRGVSAIVWKNLLVARRSKRELALASVFTLIYTAFLFALLRVFHNFMAQGDESSARDIANFNKSAAGFLAGLSLLLQWTFSFDFRRDGQHLVGFRTLPVSPFALALAEIAVPTAFCLAFELAGLAFLLIYARFDWLTLIFLLLSYPAIALALNGVWNLHYLLSAARRAGGKAQSSTSVGTLMVVALSFFIFWPASLTAERVLRHHAENLAIATALAIQYVIDFLLVVALGRLFQHFEVSRDV